LADNRICPVAAIPGCPLTATSSRSGSRLGGAMASGEAPSTGTLGAAQLRKLCSLLASGEAL
jgi:hypothetical protein